MGYFSCPSWISVGIGFLVVSGRSVFLKHFGKIAIGVSVLLLMAVAFFWMRSSSQFFPRENFPPSQRVLENKNKKVEKLLSQDEKNLRAWVDKGIVLFFSGEERTADSLNALHKAWQLGALDSRIFYYSGILYERLNLFEDARRQYERFLHNYPDDREILLRLARLYFRMGRDSDSIALYEKFLKENAQDVTALINVGLAYSSRWRTLRKDKQADPQEMERCLHEGTKVLQKAFQLQDPLPNEAGEALADFLVALSRWDEALQVVDRLSQEDENSDFLQPLKAKILEGKEQWPQALAIYEELAKGKDSSARFAKSKVKELKRKIKR